MRSASYKTMRHDNRRVSADIRRALEAQKEKYFNALHLINQPLLTYDELNVLYDKQLMLYKSIATPLGVDIDKFVSGLKQISAEKQAKMSAARQVRNLKVRDHSVATHIPSRPPPFPRFFLLHDVTMFADPPNQDAGNPLGFDEDALGQHFFGEFFVKDFNSELHASFGMIVNFVLPGADLPEQVSGGYTSTPTLFINGQLEAFGPRGDILQGQGVASGDLILSQTIYQLALGGFQKIGYASSTVSTQHFDLEDADITLILPPMPGQVEMPMVQIPSFAPEDIWVTLEVRVQCYLKSEGATLNIYQPIQMLIPEWPLIRAT